MTLSRGKEKVVGDETVESQLVSDLTFKQCLAQKKKKKKKILKASQMDGWTKDSQSKPDGWMDRWVDDGWMDGWVGGWMHG